ncbi:TPA: YHS domain protein, partial [Legionella pneumophila]|nr:YHS domain protein [Legionella pneumophila]HAT6996878.1 YHS domain protein [Legionella pneumophila]HAT7003072.1 YHS domain protein [Legionella pneumophila]HAT7011640.1 YHS domain protein [Legionella pneumophila]HAT7015339.1 YHS domain protein [Legionella pneumophila]
MVNNFIRIAAMKKIKSLYIPQLIFIFMMPVLAWASD